MVRFDVYLNLVPSFFHDNESITQLCPFTPFFQ